MPWVSLCELNDLVPGRGTYVEIDGFQLAVFLDDSGTPRTIDNTCPHANGRLADGFVDDNCAVCPLHFWAFRLSDGQMRDGPGIAVSAYPTRVHEHAGRQLVQAELPMA